MDKSLVVNIKSGAPYDVYVGRAMPRQGLRTSKWANHFRIGRDGTREDVIAKYRTHLLTTPVLMSQIAELRGLVLACWCKPLEGFNGRLLCHGQILAGLANGVPPESIG